MIFTKERLSVEIIATLFLIAHFSATADREKERYGINNENQHDVERASDVISHQRVD